VNGAGGIDLGGTKIEAQRFGSDWTLLDKRRVATPVDYEGLLFALADQVAWLRTGTSDLPVGIAAAGMLNPSNGHWIAANLPSNDRPFAADFARHVSPDVTWLNDCRAFVLAEAQFGAGAQAGVTLGLLIGTGIGGAITVEGRLVNQGAGQSGEFGHMAMSADLAQRYSLPVLKCGCGRMGCYETYASGPGMTRLALQMLNQDLTARDIIARKSEPAIAKVWDVWCEINASMIYGLQTVVDPAAIVLGGGLSNVPELIPALERHLSRFNWPGFSLPRIETAQHGETAAALGAAYAAWSTVQHV
jgi:predicted NBD/HSP70 family sugar kinase